jgi:recombination protein RecR
MKHPENIQNLIDQFSKLPGIGPKTAERFVYYLLRQPKQISYTMAAALNNLANSITHCSTCNSISETNPCLICANPSRNSSQLCVVADTHDIAAIEDTRSYQGYYHVLNGLLDPVHGITASMLKIDHLMEKIQNSKDYQEIILALNPDIEGESTMMYLKKLLQPFPVKVTRLALGLPTGADLEYADHSTLSKALSNRTTM